MRIKPFIITIILLTPLILLPIESVAQGLKFTNETAYLSEVLTHTSENEGQEAHFIGWLLNTTALNLGEKHSLNLGVMVTHGGYPSANIVGDLQTFSNLEAGTLYGFNEIYYEFKNKGFWLKLGQQDLNTDFFVSENALLFAHSSFGIDPVATIGMPAPTYPVTAISMTASIDIGDHLKFKAGVFDGQFADIKNNFLPINWKLNKDEGMLYIVEPEFKFLGGKLVQKIGFFHHSGLFINRETQNLSRGLSAFYLVSDFQFFEKGTKTANLFLQFDKSTKSVSDLNYYFGFGFQLTNYIKGKPNQIGLAIGHAELNDEFVSVRDEYNLTNETIIELNYKQEFTPWLSVQPYFQWIGINEITNSQKNPFIIALRAYIQF